MRQLNRDGHVPAKLKDIASEAGVSVATVSRVFTNARPVSDDLRERVLATAARNGYQPNLLARSLRTSRTFVFGVIVPSITDPFFAPIARAIEEVAYAEGYCVSISSSDGDVLKERLHVEALHRRRVDGAIIKVADMHRTDLSMLIESGTPIVLIDRLLQGQSLDTVTVDTRQGARSAVDYLIHRGYHRIATLAGPQHVSTAIHKLEGYRQAHLDHGLAVDESLIAYGDYTEASGRDLGRRLLDLQAPPDAFLVANNEMTYGFFTVLRERGLRVPQQVGLIGFDDAKWTAIAVPPMTVVEQPAQDVGRTAVELLLDRLRLPERPAQSRILPTRLVIRGSC